jgi:hypothetical protein
VSFASTLLYWPLLLGLHIQTCRFFGWGTISRISSLHSNMYVMKMEAYCYYALCCVLVRLKNYVLDLHCNIWYYCNDYYILYCGAIIDPGSSTLTQEFCLFLKVGRYMYVVDHLLRSQDRVKGTTIGRASVLGHTYGSPTSPPRPRSSISGRRDQPDTPTTLQLSVWTQTIISAELR